MLAVALAMATPPWLLAGEAATREPQSLEAIQRRAEAAVREALPRQRDSATRAEGTAPGASRIRIAARSLDPRLRLARCGEPLAADPPVGGFNARPVVAVRCPGPVRWSTWVPVTLESEATVQTASRTLSRGARPSPSDLTPVKLVFPGLSDDYVTSLDQIEGMHLSRPVAAGAPLLRAQFEPDPIVQKGEAVTLVARQGGMEIRAPGLALADAAPGGRLRVQNVNSLKIVEGRADSSGMVSVDP